jgi:glutamine amidotransferase
VHVTIFDHGSGNLHSLAKALRTAGATVTIEADATRSLDTDVLVLPGVGAFGAAASRLARDRRVMAQALHAGLPCLAICLGMHLLFEASDEGPGDGLGVIAGAVGRVRASRVPHIGWNSVDDCRDPLFDAAPVRMAYYANSFVCRPLDDGVVIAWSTHDSDRFPAAVRAGRTVGVQFHPEKSSAPGVAFIRAFLHQAVSP